jgi:hypothetical protein
MQILKKALQDPVYSYRIHGSITKYDDRNTIHDSHFSEWSWRKKP